jgi:hypothetical protein
VKDSSLPQSVQIGSRAHPDSYPVGAKDISPEVKRPGRESDHLPPYSAEVKNGGVIPPLLRTSSRPGAYLIMYKVNFTFFFVFTSFLLIFLDNQFLFP